jgi:predicted phosphodiesterase
MKLWAISDLHVGYRDNRELVSRLEGHEEDWLILAGDIGETVGDLEFVLKTLVPRFRRLVWVPGNHDLWSLPADGMPRGEAKYQQLVEVCRVHGVLTPEDPFELFGDGPEAHLVAPLFTLYDYSFCPEGLTPQQAKAWALEEDVVCADEKLLYPDPYESRQEWCWARCALTETRLAAALTTHTGPTVLINHFPLVEGLAVLPRVPRFSIWCGTKRTGRWHRDYRADVVVFGHLHIPGTRRIDGVRFEEVSLGYPAQWKRRPGARGLRQILPAP